jgi:hypothetical protein
MRLNFMGEIANKNNKIPKVDWKALDVVHPDAAGIDIGGSEHWVAISPERDEQPVEMLRMFYCGSGADGRVAVGARGA